MNFLFVKSLACSFRRISCVKTVVDAIARTTLITLIAFLALPISARAAALTDNDDSYTAPDTLFTPSTQEKKDFPPLALTSKILFQVMSAEIALRRNQPELAYKTYLSLLNDTHDPRMAERATEIALRRQNAADALAATRLWCQYAPHSKRAVQLKAILLVVNGKLDEARPMLAEELKKIPAANRSSAILSLQLLISRSPKPAEGLRLLQTLLKNDMQRADANFAIARQQINAGEKSKAHQSLKKALKLQPDLEPAALLLAQLGATGRQEALKIVRTFVHKNPSAHKVRLLLAQLYVADDQLPAAQQELQTYLQQYPDDLSSLITLASIELQQKHYDKAEQYLHRYLRAAREQENPNVEQAYLYLAQIALEKKDDAAAQQWLEKISATSDQPLSVQITLSQILAKAGKVEAARQLLANLNTSDPNAQALIALADSNILFSVQRYAEAEAKLEKAYKTFPNEPALLYDYAMAAEKNGHYELTEKLLRQLIKLQPDNPHYYNALGFSLADRGERLEEAHALLQKASGLAPKDPFIMDSLGWVKYRLGDAQEAIPLLREAYQLQPNAEIGAHLGEVLWMQNQHTQAKQIWQDAQKHDASNETLQKTLRRFQVAP